MDSMGFPVPRRSAATGVAPAPLASPWRSAPSPQAAARAAKRAAVALRVGDAAQALRAADVALQHDPQHAVARANRAAALFALARPADALRDFRAALAQAPQDALLHAYRADCLREFGDWHGARRAYRHALRLEPALAHAHANLGPLLLACGDESAALRHCERAVALDADNAGCWINLGQCNVELERFDAAMQAFAAAHARDPESAETCCRIAETWRECGEHEQAARWLERAWQRAPGNARVTACCAALLLDTGHGREAAQLYAELRATAPDDMPIVRALGRALWEEGDAAGALEAFRRAAQLRPHAAPLRCQIAEVLLSIGDAAGCEREYRAALALNPRCVAALAGLATTLRGRLPAADVERVRVRLGRGRLSDAARSALHAALAQHADGARDYAAAARHAAQANRLHWRDRARRGWQYDPAAHAAHVDRLIATFTPVSLARFDSGSDETRALFVVGMPRSGTTLTEQILAAHPQVLGIGERPFAARSLQELPRCVGQVCTPLDALAAATPALLQRLALEYSAEFDDLVRRHAPQRAVARVVDKMPENYELLGWLALLFPRAQFVHVRRDPRDVALSCWLQRFGQIRWACDMTHIAERLVQHRRLMAHWRAVLGARLIEFDYEALVADLPGTTRTLLAQLDLPWHDACLDHTHGAAPVRTASVSQVRQPIYASSVARWRHYAAALAPVLAVFPAENNPGECA